MPQNYLILIIIILLQLPPRILLIGFIFSLLSDIEGGKGTGGESIYGPLFEGKVLQLVVVAYYSCLSNTVKVKNKVNTHYTHFKVWPSSYTWAQPYHPSRYQATAVLAWLQGCNEVYGMGDQRPKKGRSQGSQPWDL